MPRDANGNYTLPPSYRVQTGDTLLPVQHNPPFEDVAEALTNSLARDGRTVMTGDLQMGGNKVTNIASGTNDGDALNVLQLRDRVDAVADFATVADMQADSNQRIGYAGSGARVIVAPGQIITAQGFRYEVTASDAVEFDEETAGGVRLIYPEPLPSEAAEAARNNIDALGAGILRGYISGLTLSNSSIAPNTQIEVADGVANSDNSDAIMSSSGGVINCATTGPNGLDTGALASNSWYHAFLISQNDGTTALLASRSPTAPSLPSGYTRKRRIGSFLTDGSSRIVAFKQQGNKFLWSTPVADYNRDHPGTAAVMPALTVPEGIQVDAIIWFYLATNAPTGKDPVRRVAIITSPDQANVAPAPGTASSIAVGAPGNGAANSAQAEFIVRTNTGRQVRYRVQDGGSQSFVYIVTNGWIDHL